MRLNPLSRPDPRLSPKRVFYEQPSSIKGDLLPLYQDLGQRIDVPPAAIRALAIVESDEKPFTQNGKPVIRFEVAHWKRHRIASRTALTFDKATNAKDLDRRWEQFEAMYLCQAIPAILSHSFGMFQIMGFNYAACLCADPEIFLREVLSVEGQFRMLERLILGSPDLLSALRTSDAEKVAFHFNGKGYAANKYDVRWLAATRSGGGSVWA